MLATWQTALLGLERLKKLQHLEPSPVDSVQLTSIETAHDDVSALPSAVAAAELDGSQEALVPANAVDSSEQSAQERLASPDEPIGPLSPTSASSPTANASTGGTASYAPVARNESSSNSQAETSGSSVSMGRQRSYAASIRAFCVYARAWCSWSACVAALKRPFIWGAIFSGLVAGVLSGARCTWAVTSIQLVAAGACRLVRHGRTAADALLFDHQVGKGATAKVNQRDPACHPDSLAFSAPRKCWCWSACHFGSPGMLIGLLGPQLLMHSAISFSVFRQEEWLLYLLGAPLSVFGANADKSAESLSCWNFQAPGLEISCIGA